MAGNERLICACADLHDGGPGVRFWVERYGAQVPAFAIRHGGRVYAYVNRCAHLGIELDWQEGRFFDDSGVYLICSMHGALYAPETGRCVAGPCKGAFLTPVAVEEADDMVVCREIRKR
ncbi:MAG: Rieske iron-sulfur protein [Burkholderiales bacterium]|jgi:nitrite reductase/ring-hydroxylating ferredoxin subunit|nr:MAG: Rieske iron-sulfur protein [Burkholderiales bacterium]